MVNEKPNENEKEKKRVRKEHSAYGRGKIQFRQTKGQVLEYTVRSRLASLGVSIPNICTSLLGQSEPKQAI